MALYIFTKRLLKYIEVILFLLLALSTFYLIYLALSKIFIFLLLTIK